MALENEYATASSRRSALITLFITLQMFGWIGSSILLLTVVLSRKIQRHATWINLCVTWILFGVSYSLLFLGHQLTGPLNYPFCLTQAALVYSSPTLSAGANVALAIHLLFRVRSIQQTTIQVHPMRSIMLVIFPYITFLAVFIWTLVMGLLHPDRVIRVSSGMYCGMSTSSHRKVSAAFVALTMVVTVFIEGFIITALYRNWRAYKHNNKDLLTMIIRVLCFGLFSALAVGISLVFVWFPRSSSSMPNIILALHPASFFIIFSTQKDILYIWMFWRRPQRNVLPTKPLAVRSDLSEDTVGSIESKSPLV